MTPSPRHDPSPPSGSSPTLRNLSTLTGGERAVPSRVPVAHFLLRAHFCVFQRPHTLGPYATVILSRHGAILTAMPFVLLCRETAPIMAAHDTTLTVRYLSLVPENPVIRNGPPCCICCRSLFSSGLPKPCLSTSILFFKMRAAQLVVEHFLGCSSTRQFGMSSSSCTCTISWLFRRLHSLV